MVNDNREALMRKELTELAYIKLLKTAYQGVKAIGAGRVMNAIYLIGTKQVEEPALNYLHSEADEKRTPTCTLFMTRQGSDEFTALSQVVGEQQLYQQLCDELVFFPAQGCLLLHLYLAPTVAEVKTLRQAMISLNPELEIRYLLSHGYRLLYARSQLSLYLLSIEKHKSEG